MKKLVFDCETVTPMFMSGADTNTLELRSPEFKGIMRFWWRALKAEEDIDKLREEESEIFGGSAENAHKSRILVDIEFNQNELSNSKIDFCLLPYHKKVSLVCLKPNFTFHVNLRVVDEKYNDFAKNLFLLTTVLGGFGRRSRRGFGSVQVANMNSFGYKEVSYDTVLNLINSLQNNYEIQEGRIVNTRTGACYPWIKSIEIGNRAYNSFEELLIKIGESSHKNDDPALGSAKGRTRMASPVYASVIKSGAFYKPIVTTLNACYPKKDYPSYDSQKLIDFKKEILYG